MRLFIIGDTHLSNDPRIGKPMDIFGAAWNDHQERLQQDWDACVSEEDTVIVAGDISWGMRLDEAMADLNWLHERPGTKVLIKGNHDLWWTGITKLNQLFPDMRFLQNSCYDCGDGTYICGSRGWICPGAEGFEAADEVVYNRESLRLRASLEAAAARQAENIIGVLHYPPTNDKFQPSAFTSLFEEFGVRRVYYGHLHGREAYRKGIKGNLNGVTYDLVSLDYLSCRLKEITVTD